MQTGWLSSGVPDLDGAVGGLIPGDNIVWVTDRAPAFQPFASAFLNEGARRGRACLYVRTDPDGWEPTWLDPSTTVFDAQPRGPYGDAARLEEALIEIGRTNPQAHVLVDGLDGLVRRWGPEGVAAFYGRTCPRLFDLGAIAYWRVSRGVMGNSLDRIRRVAQCVFEIGGHDLKITKAEGRPAALQGRILQLDVRDNVPALSSERALGRIGRGLQQLRRQRNLSQQDLAKFAGVSASAISQAESGHRGLSLDTLLILGERLGIGIDALLDSRPATGYVLARCPASAEPIVPLLADPDQGLLVYLIRLGPGSEGVPPFAYKGTELVAVAAGLVQLKVGPETPVMRAGDVVLAAQDPVQGWRNLISEPALLYWILKS